MEHQVLNHWSGVVLSPNQGRGELHKRKYVASEYEMAGKEATEVFHILEL